MFSSRRVWHLPVALLAVSLFLYASLTLWFSEWISFRHQPPTAFDGMLSPTTVDALYKDDRLHHAMLSLTERVAKVVIKYGEIYKAESLTALGKGLTGEVARLKKVQAMKISKRGLLEDLGSLIGGGTSGSGQQDQDLLSELSSLLGGNGTGGLGDLLQQGLAGIGNSLLSGAATPAYFLGIGIGMGTETSLNLTDVEESKAIASRVATATKAEATGFNLIAQNLGSGLAGQLAPSLSNLGGDFNAGMAIFAFAQGIGQGSAHGLNLTSQQFQPSNNSDITAIARNLGLGVTEPIVGAIDFQQLFSQGGGDIMKQIPRIAAAAGQGLGEGASNGLGLAKMNTTDAPVTRQAPMDPAQLDIPGSVQDFTRGLSQAFLSSADLSKLALGGGLNLNFDTGTLLSLASGAGKGIGEGLAISLNLTLANNVTNPATSGAGTKQTEEQIAEEFSKGLVAALLQNGGTAFLQQSVSGQGLNIDPAKAAEGAARGFVEGSVNALAMAGGLKKVIAGDFSATLARTLPALPPSPFDDSINGSAVAFARGLSGEGTLLVAQLLKNSSSLLQPSKRSVDTGESGVEWYVQLSRRADVTPLAVDGRTLQDVLQVGSNAITCQGFGGLASLVLGLKNSGTLRVDMNGLPLDNTTLAALPKEPIAIMSQGNRFAFEIQDGSITINGLKSRAFVVLTALHVVFSTIAFFYALPIYLALGALWRLSELIGYPFDETRNKKWRKIILLGLFAPSAVLGIIFGIIGMGKAPQFRTTHGVFGLLALLIVPPTVVISFLRLRTSIVPPPSSAFFGFKQLPALIKGPQRDHVVGALLVQHTLAFGMIAFIQGFSDLRSASLCIVDAVLTAPTVVALVNATAFLQTSAMALVGLRVYLERRIAKAGRAGRSNPNPEMGGPKRSDTIRTFGFESAPPDARPSMRERRTAELLGREDSKIGWPINVRKFGDEEEIPGRDLNTPATDNPFVDPAERVPGPSAMSPRIYNPKLGGYEDVSPISPVPAPVANRPSSELEPQGRFGALVPPERENARLRAPVESFSRPLTAKPSGEEVRIRYESTSYGYGR